MAPGAAPAVGELLQFQRWRDVGPFMVLRVSEVEVELWAMTLGRIACTPEELREWGWSRVRL